MLGNNFAQGVSEHYKFQGGQYPPLLVSSYGPDGSSDSKAKSRSPFWQFFREETSKLIKKSTAIFTNSINIEALDLVYV